MVTYLTGNVFFNYIEIRDLTKCNKKLMQFLGSKRVGVNTFNYCDTSLASFKFFHRAFFR